MKMKFATKINFILIALMFLIHPVFADDELDSYVNNQHEKIFMFLKENAEDKRVKSMQREVSGEVTSKFFLCKGKQ